LPSMSSPAVESIPCGRREAAPSPSALPIRVHPALAVDGSGGAFVAWAQWNGGTRNIVVRRLLASGALDPAWPAGGRFLNFGLLRSRLAGGGVRRRGWRHRHLG
jgi:hypothetical protein